MEVLPPRICCKTRRGSVCRGHKPTNAQLRTLPPPPPLLLPRFAGQRFGTTFAVPVALGRHRKEQS